MGVSNVYMKQDQWSSLLGTMLLESGKPAGFPAFGVSTPFKWLKTLNFLEVGPTLVPSRRLDMLTDL